MKSESIIYATLTLFVIIGALLVINHIPIGKPIITFAIIAGYFHLVFQNKKLKERIKELEQEQEKIAPSNG